MAKPFDATLNCLIDERLTDWASYLAARIPVPIGAVQPLDTDLSATLQADRLFQIDGPTPCVLHLELESGSRLGIPRDLLRYNTFVHHQTEMPVHSILMLLRPKAQATDQTGLLSILGADGSEYLRFRYTVIRVWEESVENLLQAGPGIAPLALLTDEAAQDLDSAFDRYLVKLRADSLDRGEEQNLLGSLFVLCGLRHKTETIETLYRRLSMTLEDSTTYQLILARGEARGEARGQARGVVLQTQAMVLQIGAKRFGAAPSTVEATIRSLADQSRLQRIADRLLDATSWDDLLATT
ncbi:MAG: hypothetical protein ACRC8S_06930 [Fimbriiglobus sp.]